jgi:hypothetical protein
MKKLQGTGVALVTPVDDKGQVDYKGLKKLLSHTAKGVDYYVVMGNATLRRRRALGRGTGCRGRHALPPP